MPFKNGKYQHETGFIILVVNGTVMVSPNHPTTIRVSDMFDSTKWKEVD